jgi:hypothetical protein
LILDLPAKNGQIIDEGGPMASVQGYFKNNVFINKSHIPIPEGQPVLVSFPDNGVVISESQRQKAVFSEFYAAIQMDTEELGEVFDKALEDRPRFHELDL